MITMMCRMFGITGRRNNSLLPDIHKNYRRLVMSAVFLFGFVPYVYFFSAWWFKKSAAFFEESAVYVVIRGIPFFDSLISAFYIF